MKDWLHGLLVSSVAFLLPIKMVILTAGILIFADLITGIFAAKKRGEKISSAGLSRTVAKLAVYQTVIVTGYMLQVNLLSNVVPVINIVGGVIGMVEFKSIIENANTILGADIFKEVIARLSSSNNQLSGIQSPAIDQSKKDDKK
jgi:phage-related holin